MDTIYPKEERYTVKREGPNFNKQGNNNVTTMWQQRKDLECINNTFFLKNVALWKKEEAGSGEECKYKGILIKKCGLLQEI